MSSRLLKLIVALPVGVILGVVGAIVFLFASIIGLPVMCYIENSWPGKQLLREEPFIGSQAHKQASLYEP